MPDALVDASPWIAIVAGVLAAALVAWSGLRTWRSWRRTRVTQQAARALVDLHVSQLDAAIGKLDAHMGALADGGEELADALGELRADVAHLRWLLEQIPEGRERLARELYELVLPTGGAAPDPGEDGDG
jgi:Flp pilus assembly protein TadB